MFTAAMVALTPAAALADGDGSLLSGYGGPGQGQQVTLGSKLIPTKHGNGSLRASAPAVQSGSGTQTSQTATPVPSGGGSSGGGGTGSGSASGHHAASSHTTSRHHAPTATTGTPAATPGTTVTKTPVIAAEPVRYPAANNSSLPLTGGDIVGLIVGLLVLAGTGVALVQLTQRRWGTGT